MLPGIFGHHSHGEIRSIVRRSVNDRRDARDDETEAHRASQLTHMIVTMWVCAPFDVDVMFSVCPFLI